MRYANRWMGGLGVFFIVAGGAGGCARTTHSIPFEKYRLDNGLTVILARDATAPIVTTNIWYHVGSKDESPGRTGFAHLFEHLMFKGSQHVPAGQYDHLMERIGGWNNASTSNDRTNYFNVGPPQTLETLLWLEADRMSTLAVTMTQEMLDVEREVVRNERRQSYENRPYGMADLVIDEEMFPPEHPYHWPVIGSHADLVAAGLEDVRGFFRRFYAPNNACLCIAGDFDPATARRWVDRSFGWIGRGETVEPPAPPPARLEAVKRRALTDDVTLPRVSMTWHSPALFAPGDAEMDLASAVLAGGKNSRLYKRLVYELKVAQSVSAYQESRQLSGLFQIQATAKPGVELAELERLIDEELSKLHAAPPTLRELDRARNGLESQMLWGLETVRARADLLNHYEYTLGEPDGLTADLDRYRRASAAAVQDTIKRVLDLDHRLIVQVTPGPKAKLPEDEASPGTDANKPDVARKVEAPAHMAEQPGLGKASPFEMVDVADLRLDNGLRVLLARRSQLPLVHLTLVVRGGDNLDPPDKLGLTTATLAMMDEGAGARTSLEIADALDFLGARLRTSASLESASVSLRVLTKHLDAALPLFVDVATRPTFPPTEWSRLQNELVTAVKQRRDVPGLLAALAFARSVYGEHPYARLGPGTVAGLESVTVDDLRAAFEGMVQPQNCTLVVVGDVDERWVRSDLARGLEHWGRDGASLPAVPEVAGMTGPRLVTVAFENAPQSAIVVGHPAVKRDTPDYAALQVLNTILGGTFTSRLNWNLREQKGYTYGARSSVGEGEQARPIVARTAVRTDVTCESVGEILHELQRICDEPVTPEELGKAKAQIRARFPQQLEMLASTAGLLLDLARYDLPLDYYTSHFRDLERLTVADVQAVAKKYLRPGEATICVVGDPGALEKLEKTYGAARKRDRDGNPVP